jgi:hypothetical protein
MENKKKDNLKCLRYVVYQIVVCLIIKVMIAMEHALDGT